MTVQIDNAIIKAGLGLNMIKNWPDHSLYFFTSDPQKDYLLRCALHLSEFKKVAETEDSIFNEEMDSLLEQLKSQVKMIFQRAINQEEKRLINEGNRVEKAKSAEVIKSFKSMNKPSPEGTVAELAALYGKSLGEIRKLKRDNLLHTLTEK
jgi:hypothetical protein